MIHISRQSPPSVRYALPGREPRVIDQCGMWTKDVTGRRAVSLSLVFLLLLSCGAIGYAVADDSGSASVCSKLPMQLPASLPVLVITTAPGDQIKDEPKIMASLKACLPGGGMDYDGKIGIEVRGSSSQRHDKKSWAIELWDEEAESVDLPFLGLPADDDWVLLGAETDRTLGLRNYMAYEISRVGFQRYASRTQFVEVFLGEEGVDLTEENYWGLYLVGEKVKRSKSRLSMDKFDSDDISGGYILKYDNDNIDESDVYFQSTASGLDYVLKYPKLKEEGAQEGLEWLSDWMSGLEEEIEHLSSSPTTNLYGLQHCIAQDAMVDYMLLTEVSKNPDGYRGSVYMHKKPGGCLIMGPAWDYNEAFGLCCGFPIEGYQSGGGEGMSPKGWRFSICQNKSLCLFDPQDGISWWFQAAWELSSFRQAVSVRWKQLRAGRLSSNNINGWLEIAAADIEEAALRNYQRWNETLHSPGFSSNAAQWSYHVEKMSEWLGERLEWMDASLNF